MSRNESRNEAVYIVSISMTLKNIGPSIMQLNQEN